MNTHDLYEQQLRYIFDKEVSEPPWFECYGILPDPFEDDALRAFEFIERLCQQPLIDLEPYSDAQVGIGLDYVFCYQLSNGFKEANVPIKRREQALRELFTLFRDVLNPRCEAKTSAFSKDPSSKIQYICYMFWDVCPLSTWMDFSGIEVGDTVARGFAGADAEKMVAEIQRRYANLDTETEAYYKAIASVMQRCLGLSNPACVESGLHGLGHLAAFLPNIAVPIIDRYLAGQKDKDKDSDLANYARIARTGMIL
ncbi:MAG: hypothetical protein ACKVUS_21790 [Saprospiraceae bacterium]